MPNATMKSIILPFLYGCIHILIVEATVTSFLPAAFTSWIWQSTIVVDNWLYIDGGEIFRNVTGSSTSLSAPNNQTFSIDLSESWNTSSVAAFAFTRNNSYGTVRRPQLYYDESHHTVYSSSGLLYDTDQDNADPVVWGFTPEASGSVEWTEKFSKRLESSFPLVSNNWDALTASSGSKHYALGGSIHFNEGNFEITTEQLVTYDYKTQTFKNQTHPFHSYAGEAQFVPQYGEEGVILFFGGIQRADRGVGNEGGVSDLSTIQVYDIHTGKFYNQTTENSLPIGRYEFCSVGVSNVGNNSHEIFIFGGSTGPTASLNNKLALAKVYILTLPHFYWIEAPKPADGFRAGQSCALIGPKATPNRNQRQMVVVGGDSRVGAGGDYVDSWKNGMKIFDLNSLMWGDDYDASAKPYVRNSVVSDYYANNPNYTVTWADTALSSIFNNSVSPITTTTAPTDETKKNKSHVGAIAGGVVGGVAALAIVGALVVFWRRRQASKLVKDGSGRDYYGLDPQTPKYKDEAGLYQPQLGEMPAGETRGEMPAGAVRTELPAVDAPVEIYTNERHELPAEVVHRSSKA